MIVRRRLKEVIFIILNVLRMRVFFFVFRYLRYIRSVLDEEKGGGFEFKLVCMRVLLDVVNGLFYFLD